jgi:hypothetical protein
MSFFQNPFLDDFEGNWVLGDRQHIPKFVLRGNAGRGKELVYAWKQGPYNLSGNDTDGAVKKFLNIVYCLHNFKNWGTLQVDLSTNVAVLASANAEEVVDSLNANTLFKERFLADVGSWTDSSVRQIRIRQKKPVTEFQFYVGNGQAEEALGFNARAGIGEMPTYFAMHTIANRFAYPGGEGKVIQLNPVLNVDAALINNAVDARGTSLGYSSATVQKDWELLRGRCGLFTFQKGPSVGAVSTTETVITYPAGAKAGDLAMKRTTRKDAGGVIVNQCDEPYTLTSGDLVTPP